MHLTNYAVNKTSKDFQASEITRHDEGSKRSVSAVFKQIEQTTGTKSADLWLKVATVAANTLMAMRPGLLEFYVHDARPRLLHPLGPKGFQIIGLDVLIDSELEPRLLELNANPSLSAVQPGLVDSAERVLSEQLLPDVTESEDPVLSARQRRSASHQLPRPSASEATLEVPIRSSRSSSVGSMAGRPARSLRGRRLGSEPGERERTVITSELDLEIKRELVSQALLISRPAPQIKVSKMRKIWNQEQHAPEAVPLDDSGTWLPPQRQSRMEAVRADAPERCPALEALDFDVLAASEVCEYAHSHLALWRCWRRNCGTSQDTLGQAQMLKILERSNLVGNAGDAVFPDKVAAQLWLLRVWRKASDGAFGLRLPQFVELIGKLGCMLLSGGLAADEDLSEASEHGRIEGVLEFVRRGLCGTGD